MASGKKTKKSSNNIFEKDIALIYMKAYHGVILDSEAKIILEMAKRTINVLIKEINDFHAKPSKKKCATNKTDAYYIDDAWTIDLVDSNIFGTKT